LLNNIVLIITMLVLRAITRKKTCKQSIL